MAKALEVGAAEGLEAVSLRRLAKELGVTPMALYRHVRDKQDLVNAMTEALLLELDLTAGFTRSLSWTARARKALDNYRDYVARRPLVLPLSIAYDGDGPIGFWRMNEALLAIVLDAGFTRHQAVVLIRVLSTLVSGYLYVLQQGAPAPHLRDERQLELMRSQIELTQRGLPPDEFPRTVESAREFAQVWIRDPSRWWADTADLIVLGLEGMLERERRRPRRQT